MKINDFFQIIINFKDEHKNGSQIYADCLNKREIWDDLSQLKEEQVNTVIVPFVNKW